MENNPTIPVRSGEELDWRALDRYLKQVLPGLEGDPDIAQYPSGNSNLTYRLRYANQDLVLRRPPFGTRPKSGHSMAREHKVMNALRPVYGTVPETLHYTDDESIIGSEFYVMARAEGLIPGRKLPQELDPSDTRKLCLAFWDRLIALHQVDYAAAGLGDFGRPQGYARRQIDGWNDRFSRALTEDVEDFEDVRQWLSDQCPDDTGRAAIIHGDFRLDNVVLDPQDPTRIVAVLDWEISALGDPLMDLGNALAYWIEADDPPGFQALQLQPSSAPGMLKREEILAYYREQTGIGVGEDFRFYRVYGYFRNAVILQQIYYRYFHGQTSDKRFAGFGQVAQMLGEHCRRLIA